MKVTSLNIARRIARAWVRVVGVLVPKTYRDRFVDEWDGEIWHADIGAGALLARCLGALPDAITSRRLAPRRGSGAFLVGHDVRFAIRGLLQRPFWTAVVVGTLAIGIGATAAIYSLVHAVLVRPLDYPDSGALVKIVGRNLETGDRGNLSPADFYDLRDASETMVSMGAHGWVGFFTVTGTASRSALLAPTSPGPFRDPGRHTLPRSSVHRIRRPSRCSSHGRSDL